MKTLVIHPDDRSTDVLRLVYQHIDQVSVISGGYRTSEIEKLIAENDRIIMLGHGSPAGLFSVGQFKDYSGFVVNGTTADLLRQKKENIYIWCHASDYVRKHSLKGFSSGMFISETYEADFCGVPNSTLKMVTESNELFCDLVGRNVLLPSKRLFDTVSKEYGELAKRNPVAKYNHERLFLAE